MDLCISYLLAYFYGQGNATNRMADSIVVFFYFHWHFISAKKLSDLTHNISLSFQRLWHIFWPKKWDGTNKGQSGLIKDNRFFWRRCPLLPRICENKKFTFQLMILLLPSLLFKWFIGWTQNNAKFREEFGKSQTWLSKTRLKYRKSEEIHWSTPIAYFLVSLLCWYSL